MSEQAHDRNASREQYNALIRSLWLRALMLSSFLNLLLSGLASLIIAHVEHGLFSLAQYISFLWQFFIIACFTTLTYTICYTAAAYMGFKLAHFLSKKKNLQSSAILVFTFPFLYLNLLLIVVQVMMYMEYGEGINYELLHLFDADGMTILKYLHRNYYVGWWLVVLAILSAATYWGISQLWKRLHLTISKRSLGLAGLVLLVTGFSGYIFAINQTFVIRHNLSILARDHGMSSLKLFTHHGVFAHNFHKSFLRKYLMRGEANDYTSAIKIAQADPASAKPTEAFPHKIKKPIQERPFNLKRKPTHIFYIQMEGHDSILMRRPDMSVLSPHLHQYAKNGIYVPNFYAAGISTNSSSIATLLSVPMFKAKKGAKMYGDTAEHSIQRQLFKHFGYKSSIHSACPYKVADHGKLLKTTEPHTLINYSDRFPEDEWLTVWGISDDIYVSEVIKNYQPTASEFAFFMPVSNHPPFICDVNKFGFSNQLVNKSNLRLFTKGDADPHKRAGHYFFADLQMHRLVSHLHKNYPDALFVITTDHYSRYSNDPQDPLANYNIPLVFWGPNVIPEEQNKTQHSWFGSHINILSTIIHLLADKPLDYYAFGCPLWVQDKFFVCKDAVGDQKHIYLIDRGKLFDYRANKIVESEKKVHTLMRWHAAMSLIGYKIFSNEDQWEQKQ